MEYSMHSHFRKQLGGGLVFFWCKGPAAKVKGKRMKKPTNVLETMVICAHNSAPPLPFSTNRLDINGTSSGEYLLTDLGTKVNRTQKPVALWHNLIAPLAAQLQYPHLVDAFAGTGSSSLAGLRLGLPVHMIERDQYQLDFTLDRLSREFPGELASAQQERVKELNEYKIKEAAYLLGAPIPVEQNIPAPQLEQLEQYINEERGRYPELFKGKPEHGVPRMSKLDPFDIELLPGTIPKKQKPIPLPHNTLREIEDKIKRETSGG
eukprot:Nk52_evm1s1138 gene=Nk52_evmTU1s1138